MTIYDDSNFRELIGDGHSIVVNGERRLLSGMPRPSGYSAAGFSRRFSDVLQVIPRGEWPARIEEQKRLKSRVSDHQKFRPTNQGSLPTCWAAGTCHVFTTQRVIQGGSLVFISPCSVAVPISGGHRGGFEGDAVEYLTKYGGVDEELWGPTDTSKALMRDERCQANREYFKSLETLELDGFDEFATACLLGFGSTVSYNWWSHVVMVADLEQIESGSFGLRIRNNWGDWKDKNEAGFSGYSVLREGKGTPSGGFMFRSVTSSTPPA